MQNANSAGSKTDDEFSWSNARHLTDANAQERARLNDGSTKRRHALEPALADEHGVAGTDRAAGRNDEARRSRRVGVGDRDAVAAGARRKAAGDRHRALDRHVGYIRILAGCRDFAENEERPI